MIPEYKPYRANREGWNRVLHGTGTSKISEALNVLIELNVCEATICYHYKLSRWSLRKAVAHYGLTLPGSRKSTKE